MEKREEKVLTNATLCFLKKGNKILLGRKTGKIGMGKLNGYGGGQEEGETLEECAVREVLEESDGVKTTVFDLEKIAIAHFHNTKSDGKKFTCTVHVYLVHVWFGTPKETTEMIDLGWYSIDSLPFEEMMPADSEWLPVALAGKKVVAHAYLSPFQEKTTLKTKIEIVKSFDE